jgi:hypothetical protein
LELTCDVGEFLDEAVKRRHRKQPVPNSPQIEKRAFGALFAILGDIHQWVALSLDSWTRGDGLQRIGARKSAGREIGTANHGGSLSQRFSSKKSCAPHSSRQRQQHTASPVKATATQATTAHTEDTRLQQYFRQDDDGRENQGHRGRDGKDAEEQGTPRPYKCAHC